MARISEFRDIDRLSPSDFVFFVRDVFEAAGWEELAIAQGEHEPSAGESGIDILARKAGRRFAIDVAQQAISDKVTLPALNRLVTDGRLARIEHLVLVTNAYFNSEVRIRALRLGVELVDRDGLKSLWEEKRSEIGNRIRPYKHQQAVIDEVREAFRAGKRRFLIEMATGLGKTYTAAHLIRELRAELGDGRRPRILFLAHQVELLLQAVTSFKNVLGIGEYTYSACFDGAAPEATDLVFGTFDTLVSRLHALPPDAFDVIIVDEAHHAAARTYSVVVEHFTPRLLLGLTATPYRTDARDIFRFFGGDEGHIGKFDLFWALKNRKLAFPRYNVFLDDLNPSVIQQLKLGVRLSDVDRRLFLHRKDEEIVDIIQSTIREQSLSHPKGIVFCRSIRHLQHFIQFFPPGTATLVHSKMKDPERRANLREFREGHYQFILVCDLFNEGIDIPEANILVFLRYTGSRIIWLQQLGRGLRKTSRKDTVHVLDFVGSLDRLQEIEAFRTGIARAPREVEEEQGERAAPLGQPAFVDEEHHDESLDVMYSHTAAQVLPLVRELQMRLRSRVDALEAMRSYWARYERVPRRDELETALEGVSADQVATHFGSYYQFLICALGEQFDLSVLKQPCLDYAREFVRKTNGVVPSFRAISLGTEDSFLLLCTDDEASELLGGAEGLRAALGAPESPQASAALPGPQHSVEEDPRRVLLSRYAGTLSTIAQLQALPAAERKEIQRVYSSLFGFLRDLQAENERRRNATKGTPS